MVKPVFLFFEGLSAPVDLGGSTELAELAATVCPGWPFTLLDQTSVPPFFRAVPDGPRFLSGRPGTQPKRTDALNALCDIIAALPQDRGFLSDCLLCLHTAAVEMNGGLVLFPNTRRAGKSTLSVALADRGYPLFTDDYLRIRRGSDDEPLGVANGIRPRLRLPTPTDLGDRSGPRNRQYLYPGVPNLPANGRASLLKALVFLERREGEVARLTPVSPDDAMRAMLYQNFGRHLHSGTTLAALATLVEGLPRYRLVYDRLGDAVALLAGEMPGLPATSVRLDRGLNQTILDDLPDPIPRWSPGQIARQVRGATARRIGDSLYLADPEGRTIERLDPMASAIWQMLEEPVRPADVTDALADAFPDTPRDRIEADVTALMQGLARALLIETP